MKKGISQLGFIIFLLFIFPLLWDQVLAASFKFDKTTASVTVGGTFQVTVTEDVGTDQTNSSQTYIIYDSTLLEAQSVAAGSYFPVVSNNIASGKVFIVGYVDGTGSVLYKTGTGNLATVTFKGLKNGSGTLTFDCRAGVSDSSQIIKYNDANATNLITCSENNSLAVKVGTGAGDTSPTGTTSSTGTTAGSTTGGSTLPQSGIMDHFNQTSAIGTGLMILGVMLRLIL